MISYSMSLCTEEEVHRWMLRKQVNRVPFASHNNYLCYVFPQYVQDVLIESEKRINVLLVQSPKGSWSGNFFQLSGGEHHSYALYSDSTLLHRINVATQQGTYPYQVNLRNTYLCEPDRFEELGIEKLPS
jgi:hypothetical protein